MSKEIDIEKLPVDDILGKRFKEFYEFVRHKKLSDLTYGVLEPNRVTGRPGDPKKNDVHEDYVNYLVTVIVFLREFEAAIPEKVSIVQKYSEPMREVFDILVKQQSDKYSSALPKIEYAFAQLPYKNIGSIKFLSPGYHLLPYTENTYPNYDDSAINGLIACIKFLYHFIASLDTSRLKATDVITFLQGDDQYFMEHIRNLVKTLMSDTILDKPIGFPSGAEDIVKRAILKGLTSVALKIINEFNDMGGQTGTIPSDVKYDPTPYDFTKAINVQKYFKDLGYMKGIPADIVSNLNGLKNYIDTGGVNANAAQIKNITDDRIKEYRRDGFLNYYYLTQDYKITVDPSDIVNQQYGGRKNISNRTNSSSQSLEQKLYFGGAKFGVPAAPAGVAVIPTYISLPFLYGPIISTGANIGKKNLITEPVQGNAGANAEIILKRFLDNVYFQGLGPAFGYGLIKNVYESNPNDIPFNYKRLVPLSIYDYMANNAIAFQALNPVKNDLRANIEKTLKGYSIIDSRLRKIPKKYKEYTKFKDYFVAEFVNHSYPHFQLNASGILILATRPIPTAKPSNFTNSVVVRFYRDHILKDIDFWGQFFNLVRIEKTAEGEPGPARLEEGANKTDAELAKSYRLNVSKVAGYTRLSGGLRGGNGPYDDIKFIHDLIPDYPTDGSVGDIWIGSTPISSTLLKPYGADALRHIIRQIYTSKLGKNQVSVLGRQISLLPIINSVRAVGIPFITYPGVMKSLLKSLVREFPEAAARWRESDLKITEDMLREASRWERDGDEFVLKDENGKVIETTDDANCSFFADNGRKCINFILNCLKSSGTGLPKSCAELMDMEFKFPASVTEIVNGIKTIHPLIARGILAQWGLGYKTIELEDPPGLKINVVQDIAEWLEELYEDKCPRKYIPVDPEGCETRSLREYLGKDVADKIIAMSKDTKKYPFFNYLDILVKWVNANPQVLNPELEKHPEWTPKLPRINATYKLYDYYHHPKKFGELIRCDCELERLKSGIISGSAGLRADGIFSTVASLPMGLNMPFNRSTIVTPYPFTSALAMYGGGNDIESELKLLSEQGGSKLIKNLYKTIMANIKRVMGDKKISLSSKTKQIVENKILRLGSLEGEVRHSLQDLTDRLRLWESTKGHVNLFKISDERLAKVIKQKHANFLDKTSQLNQETINLIELLQTIAKAFIGKVDGKGKTLTSLRYSGI